MTFPIPFQRHTLDNGLRIVLHPDRRLPLVAINLWYHVGSKNERPGRTGFAHLFEHMLFQGSEHVDTNDHFRYVQQVGGVANGSTWYDRTNYYETLPAQHLDLGLWLESDRMGFLLPAMTPEKLENQRQVVMNERRQRVDNQPYGRAIERLHELLYPSPYPYHWPVIGYMDDIAAASLDEIEDFFRTWYRPNNTVLTLAGDFDPDRALERIDHWFGDLPPGDVPSFEAPELPPLDGERREELPDRVGLPRLYVGYRTAGYGHSDWYAADLLSTMLAKGKSSVLHRELVYRRQIAQDVTSWVLPTEEAATLCVVATAQPGVEAAELQSVLDAEIERFRTDEPTPEHLERARNWLLTETYSDLQKLDQRADLLSQNATFFDDPGRVASEPERYEAVTGGDVLDLAQRITRPTERGVVTVVPAESA